MQFRVIMVHVADPQTRTPTNKQTHGQERLQYTVIRSVAKTSVYLQSHVRTCC